MTKFSIGDVCRILGVKPHIVRYWEQEIGILSPEKDISGRRVFTTADLQLLFRIKYLVHERKYTVEGAAQKILEELDGRQADAKARIHVARNDLLSVLEKIRALRADRKE